MGSSGHASHSSRRGALPARRRASNRMAISFHQSPAAQRTAIKASETAASTTFFFIRESSPPGSSADLGWSFAAAFRIYSAPRTTVKRSTRENLRAFLARHLFSAIGGMTAGAWWRLLRENRFAAEPPFWARALV